MAILDFQTFPQTMGLAALEGPQKNVWTPSIWDLGSQYLAMGRPAGCPEAGGHHCLGPPRGQASHGRGQSSVLSMDRILGGILGVSMVWLGSTLVFQCPPVDLTIWTLTPSLRFHFHGDL